MEKTVLLWFKNDLRLHDNEALIKAIASGKKVLPIYIFDPKLYRKLDLGFPKTDAVRLEFTKQCVRNLRENLIKIGSNLMILTGEPEQLIPSLVAEFDCDTIFAEQEFATEETRQIQRIKRALNGICQFDLTWGRTLYHLDDIPYTIENVPLTSKAYRINTTKKTKVRLTMPPPEHIDGLALDVKSSISFFESLKQDRDSKNTKTRALRSDSLESDLSSEESQKQNRHRSGNLWGKLPEAEELGLERERNFALTYMPGGEIEALKRLHYYSFETEQLTRYRWTRNRSLGLEYSSKFSPYLALGCLSPRTVYKTVKQYETDIKKNQSTWWLIFEMVWRDYFTFKLMRFQNKVYHTEGYTKKTRQFTNDPELFKRWCNGTTGIPFIDAHMRQLNETGFMSNRGRVNCSSFLVHDYQVDWTWGAAYFESKLIDYDVASNWMNWHTQAYEIWYTNPVNQAHKYKAQEFIRKWVPELRSSNDTEVLIPWEYDLPSYPKPHKIFSKWSRAINKIKKETS